jgi:hypothetical protein
MGTADQAGVPPPVLAEAAVSSGGYRLRWSAEWVRERFWVIPAVLLAFGTGLAVLTVRMGEFVASGGAFAAVQYRPADDGAGRSTRTRRSACGSSRTSPPRRCRPL